MKKLTLLILACASALSLFGQDSTPEMLKKKQFFDKPDLFEAQSIFADRKANEELVKEYEKSPKSYAANQLFPIAVCYTTLGDLDSAEKLLKEYIKAEPKSIRALRMLGGIYFASRKANDAKGNEQKIASAIECYKKMGEVKGENIELQEKIALMYFNIKDWDKALIAYRKLIDLEGSQSTNYLHYQNRYCEILIHKGQAQEAIEILSNLITDFPDEDSLAYTLAQAYVSIGEYEKAVDKYENLISNLPTEQTEILRNYIKL